MLNYNTILKNITMNKLYLYIIFWFKTNLSLVCTNSKPFKAYYSYSKCYEKLIIGPRRKNKFCEC